jgi:hypothetical protein
MSVALRSTHTSFLKRAAVAAAATMACAGAWAADNLPDFTFNGFVADNINISDYSVVNFTGPGTFQTSGLLGVTNFQHDGTVVTADGGLNETYGLYFSFAGDGTITNLGGGNSFGSYNNLTFSLYAYNGAGATYGVTAAGATKSATADTLLATGTLLSGGVGTVGNVPSASATLSFALTAAGQTYFTSPSPFYNLAYSAFTNTLSTVTQTGTGFTINNGGGAVNFATAVPEPETYAMIFAGLGALGFLARRRSGGNNS